METWILYFLKVNGLIIAFYAMYSLFLKKETFFKSNRMFLLLGLISALILPLITISKTVWVEPVPYTVQEIPAELFIPAVQASAGEPTPFDWQSILLPLYLMIALLLLTKMGIEITSFYRRIKDKQREKRTDCTIIHNDTTEGPFSFMNYIVVNPRQFSQEELEQIMLHEQVHVKQKHSLDILFSKIMGAIFWINPVLKWYHKAIVQNLEYIADEEVNKTLCNREAYYKTLLKIICPNNQLSTANLFYQSLIKKRIVMLQTHPSSKKKLWKYALMLPVLVAFTLMFQIETKAQVKKSTESKVSFTTVSSSFSSIITKDATDQELKEMEKAFTNDTHRLIISNVKRNDQLEIIGIKLVLELGENNFRVFERSSGHPIKDIRVFVNSDDNEGKSCGFVEINNSITESLNLEKLLSDKTRTIVIDSAQNDGKKVRVIVNSKAISSDSFNLSGDEEVSEIIRRVKSDVEQKLEGKMGTDNVFYDVKAIKLPKTTVISGDATEKIKFNSGDGTISINGKAMKLAELNNFDLNDRQKISIVMSEDMNLHGLDAKITKLIRNETKNLPIDELFIETLAAKNDIERVGFTINKKTKNEDFNKFKSALAEKNIDLKISGVKRNSLGEITSLNIQLKQGNTKLQKNIKTDYPIQTIYVGKRNGKIVIEEKN